ncbi:MAG: hypothetical protein Q9164_007362, partial [Protoblastenia rupestris]
MTRASDPEYVAFKDSDEFRHVLDEAKEMILSRPHEFADYTSQENMRKQSLSRFQVRSSMKLTVSAHPATEALNAVDECTHLARFCQHFGLAKEFVGLSNVSGCWAIGLRVADPKDDDVTIIEVGTAAAYTTIKAAKFNAAKRTIEQLHVAQNAHMIVYLTAFATPKLHRDVIPVLEEACMEMGWGKPTYSVQSGIARVDITGGSLSKHIGVGQNLKIAIRNAAWRALAEIRHIQHEEATAHWVQHSEGGILGEEDVV